MTIQSWKSQFSPSLLTVIPLIFCLKQNGMKQVVIPVILVWSMASLTSFSQSTTTRAGHQINAAINAAQFDFWIGDWDLTWNDSLKGRNTIKKQLDNYVIAEEFYNPATHFTGKSWSVYDTVSALWRQTWVDNQGGYIALTGKFENNKMILATEPVERNGKTIVSRMIFYNIGANSFDWNWEHSTDGGARWNLAWKIHYQRRK
jgi:hypothetical protein